MTYSCNTVVVTSLGNAGFLIDFGPLAMVIDPIVYTPALVQRLDTFLPTRVAAILVSHGHWDHFMAREVATIAISRDSMVVAPGQVTGELNATGFAKERVLELAPASIGGKAQTSLAGLTITAFRTNHGTEHNSYLMEFGGFRLFHDGDNEDTKLLDRKLLGGLDALMLCPWQGSGWVDFIEATKPRHWFIMHLDEHELELHEKNMFLPDVCDHVPQTPIALKPGQSYTVEKK